jgi:hypothetical protein
LRRVAVAAAVALAIGSVPSCGADPEPAASPSVAAASALTVGPWGGVEIDTVCVDGTERYRDEMGNPIVPAEGVVGGLVSVIERAEDVPLSVVASDCDAVIHVETRGATTSAMYVGAGTRTFATDVVGTLSLTAAGETDLSYRISVHGSVPDAVPDDGGNDSPEDVSFFGTASDGVCAAFAEWFAPAEDPIPGVPPVTRLNAPTRALLLAVRGSWPPRGDECGGIGEPD